MGECKAGFRLAHVLRYAYVSMNNDMATFLLQHVPVEVLFQALVMNCARTSSDPTYLWSLHYSSIVGRGYQVAPLIGLMFLKGDYGSLRHVGHKLDSKWYRCVQSQAKLPQDMWRLIDIIMKGDCADLASDSSGDLVWNLDRHARRSFPMINLDKHVTVRPIRSAPCRNCNQQMQLTKVNFSARQIALHGRSSNRGIACRQCLEATQVPCQDKLVAQLGAARARVEALPFGRDHAKAETALARLERGLRPQLPYSQEQRAAQLHAARERVKAVHFTGCFRTPTYAERQELAEAEKALARLEDTASYAKGDWVEFFASRPGSTWCPCKISDVSASGRVQIDITSGRWITPTSLNLRRWIARGPGPWRERFVRGAECDLP